MICFVSFYLFELAGAQILAIIFCIFGIIFLLFYFYDITVILSKRTSLNYFRLGICLAFKSDLNNRILVFIISSDMMCLSCFNCQIFVVAGYCN
jgi:hypothetical protein